MRTSAIAAGMLAAAVVLLAGCGGGSGGTGPGVGGQLGGAAANPVDILHKITGCQLKPGTVNGEHDMLGNRMAECFLYDNNGSEGTTFTARTNSGQVRYLPNFGPDAFVDDNSKLITGRHWVVEINGDWSTYTSWFGPAQLQRLADQLGGTVYTPRG